MPIFISILQGFVELSGVVGFLVGYFADLWWLMMVGGLIMLIDDLAEIQMGLLNPMFPTVFALILAFAISPWYVGVFWSLAIFKVLGIPGALRKIFTPRRTAERIQAS